MSDTGLCNGKTIYASRRQAEDVRRQRSRRRTFDSKVHAYKCPHCCGWHLGRQFTAKRSTVPAGMGTFRQRDGEEPSAGF